MIRRLVLPLCLCVFVVTASSQGADTTSVKLPPYTKTQLKNGMTMLLMEQHEVPLVSFNIIVKTGSVADSQGKEGLASVTAELLRKGTRKRTA